MNKNQIKCIKLISHNSLTVKCLFYLYKKSCSKYFLHNYDKYVQFSMKSKYINISCSGETIW